jgi:hypothetical protein
LDLDRRRALSNFYREEFVRHFQHLESSCLSDLSREAMDRAYRTVMRDLDSVCGRADFSAVAENLLRKFDTLTHLSELDPRRGH